MARERYLVGVTQEELERAPQAEAPSTLGGKMANFWYHYKWATIGALFVAVVGTILLVQMLTKPHPDYTLCVVAKQSLSPSGVEFLEAELEACGVDRNQNGKVEVEVQVLNITNTTSQQSVLGHMMARDVIFYALEPTYYHETIQPAMKDGVDFFAPYNGEEDYWNWKDSTLLKAEAMQAYEIWQAAPTELLFGVRGGATGEKDVADQEAYLALLRRFVETHA